MILSLISFVAGIALVILGADWLTKGASALARRFNMSELLIGLTIVAIGTSLPELVISTGSALKGSPGLALGNVIGSNIFNGLLILGVAALTSTISIAEVAIAFVHDRFKVSRKKACFIVLLR